MLSSVLVSTPISKESSGKNCFVLDCNTVCCTVGQVLSSVLVSTPISRESSGKNCFVLDCNTVCFVQ